MNILHINCISHFMKNITDEFFSEDNRNDSPFLDSWRVPDKAWVQEGKLFYSGKGHFKKAKSTAYQTFEPLSSFIALDVSNDKRIAEFARKWGVLGICKHGLPASHNHPFLDVFNPISLHCLYQGVPDACFSIGKPGQWEEPIEAWRFWVEMAKIIVSLAVDLRERRRGKPEYWCRMMYDARDLEGLPGFERLIDIEKYSNAPPVSTGQELLAKFVTAWLSATGVQPYFYWTRGKSNIFLATSAIHQLPSVLGVQMMLMISGSHSFSTCKECGELFFLTSHQSASKNSYCPKPGCKRASKTNAQKSYLARNRRNPNREKGRCLSEKRKLEIQREFEKQKGEFPYGINKILAKKHQVSESTISRLRSKTIQK